MSENIGDLGADSRAETAENHRTARKEPTQNGWRRLHPLSPLLQGGLFFVVMVGIIAANLRDRFLWMILPEGLSNRPERQDPRKSFEKSTQRDEEIIFEGEISFDFFSNTWLVIMLAITAVAVIIAFFTWLSWLYNSYRITHEAVETKTGIVFRKSRRAPLDRIQSVNLQRPLLARMLGLTRIDIQTGGQGGNATLSYLGHAEAKRVRDEILRTAHAVSEAKQGSQPKHGISLIHGISPMHAENSDVNAEAAPAKSPKHGEIPRHGIISEQSKISHLGAKVSAFDVDAHMQTVTDSDVEEWAQASAVRVPMKRLLAATFLSNESIILLALLIAVPVLAFFWSWNFLVTLIPGIIAIVGVSFNRFNKGFRFTISKTLTGVRTGSGLTATSTETIPSHRIHAIDILQPIAWRPFGWWRIRITTAGTAKSSSSSNQQMFQNIVLPVGKLDDVTKVVELLMPDLETAQIEEFLTQETGFVRSPRKAFWVLLWGRSYSGVRIEDARMHIRRGALTRHQVIMPLTKSQSVLFARPLMHYILGLASVQIHTVMGPVNVTARGIEKEKAAELFTEITGIKK